MHDHIIDKRPLRIEQRRILRLSHGQSGRIVHGNVLHRGQRLRSRQANVAHVADIEDAHARAYRHVLADDSAADRRRVFHGHVPAIELHHPRPYLAMEGVQRSFADGGGRAGGRRLNRRQNRNLNQRAAAGLLGMV